jgi:hypothetical protein
MPQNASEFVKLKKQVDSPQKVASVMGAVMVLGFTAGIIWVTLLMHEGRVNTQGPQIEAIEKQIHEFKHNLGDLGLDISDSYVTEVLETEVGKDKDPLGTRCRKGNVVTGLRHDGQKIWIRCVSLGRAAYNPGDEKPGETPQKSR